VLCVGFGVRVWILFSFRSRMGWDYNRLQITCHLFSSAESSTKVSRMQRGFKRARIFDYLVKTSMARRCCFLDRYDC
jgi:hypothetical protein